MPTLYQAQEAHRVVMKYAEHTLVVPRDCEFFILLGKIEEKLLGHQRQDFMDVCTQTGFHCE